MWFIQRTARIYLTLFEISIFANDCKIMFFLNLSKLNESIHFQIALKSSILCYALLNGYDDYSKFGNCHLV